MNDERSTETFSDEEREALGAWTPSELPEGFAARVLRRVGLADARRRRRRIVGYALAASAAAAVLAAVVWRSSDEPAPARGSLAARERSTVRVGNRAVVVAEAGTTLRWEVAAGGAASVEQPVGNAFYRVEGGGPFSVGTPLGEVRVRGTCFRVEVKAMTASKASAAGALAGAAVASAVIVTVYEGSVVTASPRGERAVEAGQVAELRPGAPPRVAGELGRAVVAPAATPSGATAAPRKSEAGGGAATASTPLERQLAAEAAQLRRQVEELRSRLGEGSGEPRRKYRTFDLSKEELLQMAERCELRWDHPTLGEGGPPQVHEPTAQKLGLGDHEKTLVNQVLREHYERARGTIRKLYVELTGDEAGSVLSSRAMRSEIVDKLPREEVQRLFQRLSRERAGLEPPPPDLSKASVPERLFRLLSALGNDVEKAIGAQIGPDLARRYREMNDGFGTAARSSWGCPPAR